MKELSYHYHLKISTNSEIQNHNFNLRCTPVSDARQDILEMKYSVQPCDYLRQSSDAWGNSTLYGCCRSGHDSFEADVSGRAQVGFTQCVPSRDPVRDEVFRHFTPLTAADDALRDFAASLKLSGTDLTKAEAIMRAVHNALRYVPGSTDVNTTAAQAFAGRCGVCQDYSHVMLSVLRMEHIPCRYVAGMMLGEGKSHAWVEVLYKGGWYAFDPTNCRIVDDEHIKLSHGRDYRDCTINRGVFRGAADQTTDISVIVTEIN